MNRENFQGRGTLTLEEKKFVAHVLAKEAKIIEHEQNKVIEKFGLYRTGIMKNRRTYQIKGAGNWMSGFLELSFVKYLRFHDMKPKNRFSSSNKRADGYYSILGVEKATRTRRRQYHLYNRIIFGRMSAIAARLNVGFTEEVKKQLAEDYEIPITL